MATTSVILLERMDKLGNLGDVVTVRPGYARNYLLPQKKAMRASKENIAYFEAQKAGIEKANNEKKAAAEKQSKKVEGAVVTLIRQASEAGQLFGSVSARDIAEGVAAETGEAIDRTQVMLNTNFKLIGLFPVEIALHPEVKVEITVNIARSEDEAAIQKKTGKAVIAQEEEASAASEQDNNKAHMLEDSALEAEKLAAEEQAIKDAEEAARAEERAAKKAAKAEAAADDADAESADVEDAPEAEEKSD